MSDLISADGTIRISDKPLGDPASFHARARTVPIESNLPGTTLLRFPIDGEQELLRLALFQGEIDDVLRWCDVVKDEDASPYARESAALAAVIRFVGCFDGTSGLRRTPLSRKAIYAPPDRRLVGALHRLRNTQIAHDEQLYPGSLAFYLLDNKANAVWISALQLSGLQSSGTYIDDIARLCGIAKLWLADAFETKARELVEAFNALPADLRMTLKHKAPPYSVTLQAEAPQDSGK